MALRFSSLLLQLDPVMVYYLETRHHQARKKRGERLAKTDMTSGNIGRHLIRYAIPLVLGNLFQLSYHFFDAMIAGRWIGQQALAAEGAAGPVMNVLILGISGLSIGAGVLMSEFFGAGNMAKLKKELATVLVFGLMFSVSATVLGIALTHPLLRALKVPEEIFDMTATYLRIVFLGVPFTYFYNALSSALKSVGDSKTPLKFLMFSSLLNAALDVVLIGLMGFGIVCSAVTTVVAEGVSAALCMVYILRRVPEIAPEKKDWQPDKHLLAQTLKYGSVTALQQSCQPIGKLLIQGCVNGLGVEVMAAFNAVNRVDDFAFTPEQSISHAMTVFIAQNRGKAEADAGQQSARRIRRGFYTGMALEAAYWVLICSAVLLLKRPLMSLFVKAPASTGVIDTGVTYLGVMAFFYLFPAMTNGMQGYFRGCARMKVTLLGTLIQTSIRVLATYTLAPRLGMVGIAFACAMGWSAMLLFEIPYYFFTRKGL